MTDDDAYHFYDIENPYLYIGCCQIFVSELSQLNGAVDIPHIINPPSKSKVISLFSRKYFIILFNILNHFDVEKMSYTTNHMISFRRKCKSISK